MPRLKTGYKPQQAQLPDKAESAGEIKVQKLGLLLDQCSWEGILDHQALLSKNDCPFCPSRELCDKVWDECIDYTNGLEYDEAKVKLEAVFAEKREFAGGNGHRGKYNRAQRENIKQVARFWRRPGMSQLKQYQIAAQIGVSLRTVVRCVAILKKENDNG